MPSAADIDVLVRSMKVPSEMLFVASVKVVVPLTEIVAVIVGDVGELGCKTRITTRVRSKLPEYLFTESEVVSVLLWFALSAAEVSVEVLVTAQAFDWVSTSTGV